MVKTQKTGRCGNNGLYGTNERDPNLIDPENFTMDSYNSILYCTNERDPNRTFFLLCHPSTNIVFCTGPTPVGNTR